MREGQKFLFEPEFNRAVKVIKKNESLTSDAGVLLLREVDHRLGITAELAEALQDPRDPALIRYKLVELLRERLYAMGQGYSAQDDLDILAHDPAMKAAVWDRPGDQVADERLASQPTQSRLLDILTATKGNQETLRGFLATTLRRHQRVTGQDQRVLRGTLDVDGFPVAVSGQQAGAAYNGYHRQVEYYPLVASFSVEGDYDHERRGNGFLHAILRKGNAAGAEGALRFILRAVEKAQPLARCLNVRFDAAFTIGKIMDPLTDRRIFFVGRLRSNARLDQLAEPWLSRPVGRPPKEGYENVIELGWHRAAGWRHAQRVVLVIVDKPAPTGQLALLPDYFFLITNWREANMSAEELLAHYRGRGTFEDRFGEFNQALGASLSSPRFEENEASLLLALLAFNLTNILRMEMERGSPNGWDLGRLQRTVLKAGARLVTGGRRLTFYLAAAAARLWERLLKRIDCWRSPLHGPQPHPRSWMPPPDHAHRFLVLRE
jgi:hypothetical protein